MTVRRKNSKTFMSSSDVMNQNHYKEEAYLTINYKSLKKKPKWMINSDLLFVYIMMLSFDPVLSQHEVQTCAPATQQSIFNSLPQCESRTTLVDLRQYFDNNHDVIQVVPDHVMVERCGGSCYIEQYTCLPAQKSIKTVEVMLILSKWPQGEHEVKCSTVEVEVHDTCKCGCKLKKENCNKLQYYHEPSCGCFCNNPEERSECISSNKVWDPNTCQCHCPLDTIQPCPTGYIFDFSSSCKCVLVGLDASEGLIAGIVVLLFLSVTIIISLSIMHKHKTGLFKEDNFSNAASRRSTSESQANRTVLMSQESKYEYEIANKDSDVTLLQFDLSKKSSLPKFSV